MTQNIPLNFFDNTQWDNETVTLLNLSRFIDNVIFEEKFINLNILKVLIAFLFVSILKHLNILSKNTNVQHSNSAEKSIKNLPGPKPFPLKIIGNLLQLPASGDIIPKCFEWCAKYGPCFRLTLLKEDFVVISNASLAQVILQSNELGHLTKTDVYHFLPGIHGLAFAKGKWWQNMRKTLAQSLRYQRTDHQIKIYNDLGNNLVKRILKRTNSLDKTGKEISVELEIASCAAQIIIDAFISQTGICSHDEALVYVKNWKRYTEISAHKMLTPWLSLNFFWKRHPHYNERKTVIQDIENFSENLINRHIKRQQLKKENGQEDVSSDQTLISEMQKLNFSFKEIRNQVFTMLIAHETNSLGLYYLLYLLAINPEHQQKCQEEIDELFKNRDPNNLEITPDHLSRLKYLERCFYEAMRLLPPVYIFGRKLESPLTLPNGVHLSSGTNCIILPIVIHRNPEHWHGDTLKFDPDRFLSENSKLRSSYAFVPFSAGPRICLGMKSSIINVKIICAKILQKFRVSSMLKFDEIRFQLELTTVIEQDLDLQFELRS